MTWQQAMDKANKLAALYGLPFRVYSIRYPDGRWTYDVTPIPFVPAPLISR